jgi:hypothetical protein
MLRLCVCVRVHECVCVCHCCSVAENVCPSHIGQSPDHVMGCMKSLQRLLAACGSQVVNLMFTVLLLLTASEVLWCGLHMLSLNCEELLIVFKLTQPCLMFMAVCLPYTDQTNSLKEHN